MEINHKMNKKEDFDLIAAYLGNSLNEEEYTEFMRKLDSDQEFEKNFFQLKDVWDAANNVKIKSNDDYLWQRLHDRIAPGNTKPKEKKLKMIYFHFFKYAAVVLLLISLSLAGYLYFRQQKTVQEIHYITTSVPTRQKGMVKLPDGSKVWLNSESALKYPSDFASRNREVFLNGEAFFEVTHDQQKPFIVKTSGINIKVLGTSFNVMSYEEDNLIETTVVSGSVSISEMPDSKKNNKANEIILKPDQQAIYNKQEANINLTNVDAKLYTTWKEGEYIFNNEMLVDIVKKIERWYEVKVIFRDESIKNYRLSGSFKDNETIIQILDMISLAAHVSYIIDDNNIILESEKI